MIINMVGGGGGAALNFKVVPGLTQPGTASENTIWVKTERIGVWHFSVTQPENMQEWDVWFPTGTESDVEFDALKKNGIQVYPLSAMQMISGSLVDVTAKSYQDNKWVTWIPVGALFWEGDQFTDITGGWTGSGWGSAQPGSVVDGCLKIVGHSGGHDAIGTKKLIDLSKYKVLKVNVTSTGGYTTCAGTTKPSSYSGNTSFSKDITDGENIIDVSQIDSAYVFFVSTSANTTTVTIDKVWRE